LHTCTEIIDENGDFFEIQSPRPEFESALSLLYNRWDNRRRQYIGDFCFKVEPLRKNKGFYKLPLAWCSDDISAVRASLSHGIANVAEPGFQYRINRLTISKNGSALIKIEANNQAKEWYLNLFRTLDDTTLSKLDDFYLIAAKGIIDSHFNKELDRCIVSDISASMIRTFFWLKSRRSYNISFLRLFILFMKSVKVAYIDNRHS
jgi:hypothetical protein